jgi:hypothetical protein
MSDEKLTTIGNIQKDAKKLAEELASLSVVHNQPDRHITNSINELIMGLTGVMKALDVYFETDTPELGRLRTAWQEFQYSWDRTYPKGTMRWVPDQTWRDCSETAHNFSVLMQGFSA